jgi:hypothetical protein
VEDIAIVVQTCDKYSFCWPGWAYYFNLFWDFNFRAKIYFANEEKEINFQLKKPINQIKTGVYEFSNRLIKILDYIEEKNIFYIQEDAWIQQKIDINSIYDCFVKFNMNNLKVCSDNQLGYMKNLEIVFDDNKPCVVDETFLRKIIGPENFLISHQAGFWKKEFLRSYLEPNENPWMNEINSTCRLLGGTLEKTNNPNYFAALKLNKNIDVSSLKIYTLPKSWYYGVCSRGYFNEKGLNLNI